MRAPQPSIRAVIAGKGESKNPEASQEHRVSCPHSPPQLPCPACTAHWASFLGRALTRTALAGPQHREPPRVSSLSPHQKSGGHTELWMADPFPGWASLSCSTWRGRADSNSGLLALGRSPCAAGRTWALFLVTSHISPQFRHQDVIVSFL